MEEEFEKQVRYSFEKGLSLFQLRRALFSHLYEGTHEVDRKKRNRQRSKSTKVILAVLGFNNQTQYEMELYKNRRRTSDESLFGMQPKRTKGIKFRA